MHRIKQIFVNHPYEVDAILIKNPGESSTDENFFYFTGLKQGLFEGACTLLTPDGKLELFVSELEAQSAYHTNAIQHTYSTNQELYTLLQNALKSYKSVGLNYSRLRMIDFSLLVKKYPDITFVDISKSIQTTRMIKDIDEIDKIRRACNITDKVMNKIPELITPKIKESQLAAEINYLLQKYGASHPAFDTISSFGSHSAEPHYTNGDTEISQQDFIVCDFGGTYQRYNADITRTFVYGTPSTQQKKIYETVLQAQTVGFDTIQPEISAKTVHKSVEKIINKTEFKGRFIHSTGHALGLLVHDGPGFNNENDLILKENMVFSVEPGIYLPNLGGVRIEDDIRVTQNGYELLSNSHRDLIEIEND
jgi:Xaa-Pro dipeptidase